MAMHWASLPCSPCIRWLGHSMCLLARDVLVCCFPPLSCKPLSVDSSETCDIVSAYCYTWCACVCDLAASRFKGLVLVLV